jgi:hypothetical protein
MARLTKADAARQLGIFRTTLYKLIDQGRVSATPDGLIDDTELVHAAPYVDILKERSRTSMDNTDMDMNPRYDEPRERPLEPVHEHPWTGVHERQWTSTDPLVEVLREQLQRVQERERVYEECERAYHDHIARLTAMLHEAQQQNQRLLDRPRPSPPPRLSPASRPVVSRPPAPPGILPVPCAGISWRSFRNIPRASRLRRCGRCWAWREAWRIRAWGCCGMGWCSVWGEGGMWQPTHQGTIDDAKIHHD